MSHSERIETEAGEISYLKEMVTSSTSIYGLLGTLTVAALLSIPLGVGIAAIPVLFFTAVQAIAALFIPSSPIFQAAVQKRKRAERRQNSREHLVEEIERRDTGEGQFHWRAYHRMRERVESLNQIAGNRQTAMSERDVERLDDATVDYLGLWLAWLVMAERWQNVDEDGIAKRVEAINRQLDKLDDSTERRRLEKARIDLERILARRKTLWGRATEVEAKMLAMTDTLEEVYQRVITNPNSDDATQQLQDALERMKVEEKIDMAVDAELDTLLSKGRKAAAAKARATH
ncbi:MAG: hypothetical protein P8R54_27695 [Myxococcota bacterium]|nr:hypothetical protein [Myxococcota bacterium]